MEWIKLIASLFATILAPALMVWLIFSIKDKHLTHASRLIKVDTKNTILEQPFFWLSILIPISGFLIFGYYAWEGYDLDLSKKGYDKFWELSKLPLSILATIVPLTVTASAIFASAQNKEIIISQEFSRLEERFNNTFARMGELMIYDNTKVDLSKVNPQLFINNVQLIDGKININKKGLQAIHDLTELYIKYWNLIEICLREKKNEVAELKDLYIGCCIINELLMRKLGLYELLEEINKRSIVFDRSKLKGNENAEKHPGRSIGNSIRDIATCGSVYKYVLNTMSAMLGEKDFLIKSELKNSENVYIHDFDTTELIKKLCLINGNVFGYYDARTETYVNYIPSKE